MQVVAHDRPRTAKQRQASDVLPASRLGPGITSQRTDRKIRDSVLVPKKSSIYPHEEGLATTCPEFLLPPRGFVSTLRPEPSRACAHPIAVDEIQDRDSGKSSEATSNVLVAENSSIFPTVHNAGAPPIAVDEIKDRDCRKSSEVTSSVLVVKKSSIYPPVQNAGASLNQPAEKSGSSSPPIEPPRPMLPPLAPEHLYSMYPSFQNANAPLNQPAEINVSSSPSLVPELLHSSYPSFQNAGAPLNQPPEISVPRSIYPTISEHEPSSTAPSAPILPSEISASSSPPAERYFGISFVDGFSAPRGEAFPVEYASSASHVEPRLNDAVSILNDPDWVIVPYDLIDEAGTESRFVACMREECLEVDGDWLLVPRCPIYSQAQPSGNVLVLHRKAYSFLKSLPSCLSRVFHAHISSERQDQALRLALSFVNQVFSCLLSLSRTIREEISRHVPKALITTLKTSAAAFVGFSVLLGHPFAVLHLLTSLWKLSPPISIFLAAMALEWLWSASGGSRSKFSVATKQFLLEKVWPLLIAAEHQKTN